MASTIPERISRIYEISRNLWWSWDHHGRDLFRSLDYTLWRTTRHNSIEILNKISNEVLIKKSKDPSFLNLYDKVVKIYDDYMDLKNKWFYNNISKKLENPIAYFSFEYGLHQSLPIYSGGLGVLAGDTCKEASDLGLPFIAIGFYYHQGYFDQFMTPNGWQEAQFNKVAFDKLPIDPLLDKDGQRVTIKVQISADIITLQVWVVQVGTVKLYLLDADINDNKPWYRGLSSRLYGGDHEMRINQELLLGIGGVKLLDKLDVQPSVWHLNEGHCSFLTIERITNLVTSGIQFEEALAHVRKTTIFTTHTPVPAGHDRFPVDLVDEKLSGKWDDIGISRETFFQLGIDRYNDDSLFNMTILGINTSHLVNTVSKLHLEVTQNMFKQLFEDRKSDTRLLGITNGVHLPTFIAGPLRRLFSQYIHPNWIDKQDDQSIWSKIVDIPDHIYWDVQKQNKDRLMFYIRETARQYRMKGVMGAEQILASGPFLDPNALTIGFARRFATYKRADLIFQDIERIRSMLNDPYKPVQIIFAGKAHPADEEGKHILQKVYEQALSEKNGGRVAFLENYDIHMARYLVQGVDVWLNNPIRPHEASGTSGMKAAANGAPHFSISDGWWAEGYAGNNGWVIGSTGDTSSAEEQDQRDVSSLYAKLEEEIVPLFYDRDSDFLPRKWIEVSKESIKSNIAQFSARRMLKEYVEKMYTLSMENYFSSPLNKE